MPFLTLFRWAGLFLWISLPKECISGFMFSTFLKFLGSSFFDAVLLCTTLLYSMWTNVPFHVTYLHFPTVAGSFFKKTDDG